MLMQMRSMRSRGGGSKGNDSLWLLVIPVLVIGMVMAGAYVLALRAEALRAARGACLSSRTEQRCSHTSTGAAAGCGPVSLCTKWEREP